MEHSELLGGTCGVLGNAWPPTQTASVGIPALALSPLGDIGQVVTKLHFMEFPGGTAGEEFDLGSAAAQVTGVAWVPPLAWELPYAEDTAEKKKSKPKNPLLELFHLQYSSIYCIGYLKIEWFNLENEW